MMHFQRINRAGAPPNPAARDPAGAGVGVGAGAGAGQSAANCGCREWHFDWKNDRGR